MTARTISDAAAALRDGSVTSAELVEESIAAADALDATLGIYITRFDDNARAAAAESDRRISAGAPLSPLDGIPIGMKDIVSDSQGPTTAQSLVLDPAWGEGVGDATVVQRLKAAGAIITGKATTMEFAIGAPDPSKPFPIPRNAWDTDLWAGGSSSGSGNGVAAGAFLGAIGTDTGGSIRIPAAFNGVSGLKATFGRVPKSGVVPLGYTLDHVGPLARSARDCALMLSAIAGADELDPYASREPVEDYLTGLTGDLTGMRIGVDRFDAYAAGGIDPLQPGLFSDALTTLEAAGAELVDVTMPRYEELTAIDMTVMASEAYGYHHQDIWNRWNDYGQPTRIFISSGEGVTGADYIQAQRVRRIAQAEVEALLDTVDAVVTPTAHLGATRFDEMSTLRPLSSLSSLHAPYWNPLGLPTLVVPIGLSSVGSPLSLTISAKAFQEATVLAVGDAYQARTEFHLDVSPLVAGATAPAELV